MSCRPRARLKAEGRKLSGRSYAPIIRRERLPKKEPRSPGDRESIFESAIHHGQGTVEQGSGWVASADVVGLESSGFGLSVGLGAVLQEAWRALAHGRGSDRCRIRAV